MADSFGSKGVLSVGGRDYSVFRLSAVAKRFPQVDKLPFSLKILLENLLRKEDGLSVDADDIEGLATWDGKAAASREIAFTPSRVLLQDFTGVPAVVDFAAMRDAMKNMGGDPTKINPLQPAELVVDHSVQVDQFGTAQALQANSDREYERNQERYRFLRWGQNALKNFRVVPPETGIVHQVNLEYLARVVFTETGGDGSMTLYPDTLVGTDSHTTMINGLGVLGWGVGGIEAEAAMLGQPVSMLIPQVIGFRLTGRLPEGATATDLVLTVTEQLRKKGVVGKFVEYFGDGLSQLTLADRATIANMSPEYGATCGIFPIDDETLVYMRLTGRSDDHIRIVEAYAKEQGMFHNAETPQANYSDVVELDLAQVEPSMAGPTRPQDRFALANVKKSFLSAVPNLRRNKDKKPTPDDESRLMGEGGAQTAVGAKESLQDTEFVSIKLNNGTHQLQHGSVVIAAITSCTNTSNPSVMLAAGLVAKKAVERGLKTKPWVKTSLAPGSKTVRDYLIQANLLRHLEQLGFFLVGYGCTTCIGNSGPLPEPVADAIRDHDLVVAGVLSGNRNFEGRIHPDVRANYLASPPLVVAYALAGRMDIDLTTEPIGNDDKGKPVYLKDIWPTQSEINDTVKTCVQSEMFSTVYADVFKGDERWSTLDVPKGELFAWQPDSTYVKHPPYFENMPADAPSLGDIENARCLLKLGDSITTDHISPAGAIKVDSPAGKYLIDNGVEPVEFNSYGSRRGNHEVMMRGTFANVRLRNQLAPGTEGGFTRHFPDGELTTIFEASMKYKEEKVPLVVLAGKEYGSGSSRDWAAKGPCLLGVRCVVAKSYERIHRSNLIGMGILPLQFCDGDDIASLGLSGEETFAITGVADALENDFAPGKLVTVAAKSDDGGEKSFQAVVRIDTPKEVDYYRHGGILQYVLRQLVKK